MIDRLTLSENRGFKDGVTGYERMVFGDAVTQTPLDETLAYIRGREKGICQRHRDEIAARQANG